MAIMQGIAGGLSGKMGAVVFRQDKGQTIASKYQPQITNPNTKGQQAQRARFKLATQLAAIMSPGFGTMSVAKRPAHKSPSPRNKFVEINMPLITAETVEGGYKAMVKMDAIQLTTGFRSLPNAIVQDDSGQFIYIEMQHVPEDIASVRIVAVGYNDGQPAIIHLDEVPVENGEMSTNFAAGVAGDYTVLMYGLIPTSDAGKLSLDNIHNAPNQKFYSAVELDHMVQEGLITETKTVGYNVTVA